MWNHFGGYRRTDLQGFKLRQLLQSVRILVSEDFNLFLFHLVLTGTATVGPQAFIAELAVKGRMASAHQLCLPL